MSKKDTHFFSPMLNINKEIVIYKYQ